MDEEEDQSCNVLKICVELRNKYLCAHPIPPQDRIETINNSPELLKSPSKMPFRRRQDPVYNVFNRPIPSAVFHYKYQMENGVFNVYKECASTDSSPPDTTTSSTTPASDVIERVKAFEYISFKEFVKDFEYVCKSNIAMIYAFSSYV